MINCQRICRRDFTWIEKAMLNLWIKSAVITLILNIVQLDGQAVTSIRFTHIALSIYIIIYNYTYIYASNDNQEGQCYV